MKKLAFVLSGCVLALAAQADELTLETALQATVSGNPEIQKAKAGLEKAAGGRLVLRAVAWPDGVVGIAGGHQGGKRAGEKSNQPFGFAYGNFTQPIFNAAIPASYRRADVELLIAQQQLNMAMTEQLHVARLSFYTALYNRSLEKLREEQRQRLEENVRGQKDRYEAGLTDRGVFTAAEVQTRELDPRVQTAQRAYNSALLKLAEAMGTDLGGDTALPKPQGDLTFAKVDVDLDAATTMALKSRADLKLARLFMRAADEDQRIIVAGYYPLISATVAGEYIPVTGIRRQSQGSPSRTDDFISSEVRAGAAYTWRVDNGKVYGAAMRQRRIREINELELKKMEANVPRELARIRNNLDGIATKERELSTATAAAEQNTKIVQQNLAAGVASQLEFRQIENAMLETKTALVTLAFQQKAALAEWDRAIGRYLQFSEDSAQKVH